MTAARDRLSTTDELLLEAIGRRLATIDDELPRLRPWRPDRVAAGQLHVVRGHVRRAGSARAVRASRGARIQVEIAAAAVAMAAAFVVAIVAGTHGSDVGRPAGITAATPPGPAFSFGPGRSAFAAAPSTTAIVPDRTPTPTASRPASPPRETPGGRTGGLTPVGLDQGGIQAVLGRLAWRCGVLIQVALDPLPAGAIDKLALTTDGDGGFLPDAFGPGWIGSDPLLAAHAFKGRPLLLDATGSLWIVRGDGGDAIVIQLVPQRAASGAMAWRSADVLWPVACPAAADVDAKSLVSGRPPGDWPTGQIVDLGVVRWLPHAVAPGQPS
jgi:hypothetical protein